MLPVLLASAPFACVPEGRPISQLDGALETSPLAPLIQSAAERFHVPADLLKAIAYHETRFEPAAGTVEFDGQPGSFGYFGLRGEALDRGAALLARDAAELRADQTLGIDAAAALLDAHAHDAGLADADRGDPAAWGAAIARWNGLDSALAAGFVADVLGELKTGRVINLQDGTTLVIRRHALSGLADSLSAITGAGNSIYLPSPNYNSRNGSSVELVVIHDCEGSYGSCVSWLRNSAAEASAHYVVKENGAEIAQLVDEANRAWHVAASYRPWLNDGALPGRSGQSVNTFSIGIEHAGYASQSSWPQGQIDASVALVRDITARHGIPRDRYHIVSHGRLQPEDRTDPGPNWPWASYIAAIQAGPMPPPEPQDPPKNPGGKFFSRGDFDGDGRTDWAWFAPWTNDFIVMLSKGDGTWRDAHNDTSGWGRWSDLAQHFSTGDFNGDGKTDWAWYAFWTNDFIVMLSNGDGSFSEVHNDTTGWGNWADGKHFTTGDFNGDGRTDWSWYAPWTDDFIVMLSTGDGKFAQVHNGTKEWGAWSDGKFFSTGDFDGDGNTDWSWFAPWTSDFIVMLSNGDGTYRQAHNSIGDWGDWAGAAKFFSTGDFDGDGRTDWSWYADWTDDFIVMLSKGDGSFRQVHNGTSGWGKWGDGRHFAVGDYDGDGRADWSWYAPWTNDFIVMLSNGDGTYRQAHNDTTAWGDWADGEFFETGDFNGDGSTDWSWYAPWTDDHIVMLSDKRGGFSQAHNNTSGWGKF